MREKTPQVEEGKKLQRNIKSPFFSFLLENFSGWEHCTTFGLVAGNMNSVIQIDVIFYYIIYLFFYFYTSTG